MIILAIDPAEKTGWAISKKDHGMWDFKRKKDESWGTQLLKFKGKLIQTHVKYKFQLLVFERVSGINANAIMSHSKYIAVIEMFCDQHKIEYIGYSAGTIKKFATGMGNAKKPEMIAAAQKKYGYKGNDDNTADALHLLHLAIQEFS